MRCQRKRVKEKIGMLEEGMILFIFGMFVRDLN